MNKSYWVKYKVLRGLDWHTKEAWVDVGNGCDHETLEDWWYSDVACWHDTPEIITIVKL